MESLCIVGNGGVPTCQAFARLDTTRVGFRPRAQLGFGCFVRERYKYGNLVIARSGRSEVGNSKDGNFAVENEKEEKRGGLILGPERDSSGSVIGFNLIPPSGMDISFTVILSKLKFHGF
jgi:starch synthase